VILRLLALPVTGPARAGWWLLEQILAAAEDDLYDEDRIVARIRALADEFEAGNITEEEHAFAEEALLEQLVEARAFHAAREETT
jgi:hypothetical protein